MLWEHERDYGLGMDALVSVCSWNTNEIMAWVWAWMLWSAYALGTRTRLWFGHGCSGQRMLLNTKEIMVWAWMLWSAYARDGLGMDALVSVCSGNRNEIMPPRTECAFRQGSLGDVSPKTSYTQVTSDRLVSLPSRTKLAFRDLPSYNPTEKGFQTGMSLKDGKSKERHHVRGHTYWIGVHFANTWPAALATNVLKRTV